MRRASYNARRVPCGGFFRRRRLCGEKELPYLASISIFPVKSLDAVSVETARVLPSGALADDRRFAIVDSLGQYVNGKRNARVHLLRSSFDPVTRNLKLSAEVGTDKRVFDVDSERAALEEWLAEFFGFPVSFRENTAAGFPDDTDSPGPTLISTATLREVGSWFDLTVEQARGRFRANLEIDGVPPFWEDQLYGERGTTVRFRIGEAVFDGVNPCQRCVVPARDPATGRDSRDFAKRFVEMRKKRFPEWAEASRFNHYYRLAVNTKLVGNKSALFLSTGDRVQIIGPHIEKPANAPTPAPVAAPVLQPSRWTGEMRIAGVAENTPSVRTLRLAGLDGGDLPFTFLPGQYLNLELTIEGRVHRRCYTIASAPTQTKYCEITIKREGWGTASRYLHDHLREGMPLRISAPGGRFTFTGNEADSVALIGAGVGITPLMSVIRYLTDRQWPGPIDLIYSARTEQEIIFNDELKSLAQRFPNLNVTTTLSQEPGPHWSGARGRINRDLLARALPRRQGQRIHICGPLAMAAEVTQMLHAAGISPDQIQSEAFGGAPAPPTASHPDANGPVVGTITFASSGKSLPARHCQSVIDIADRGGIPIDHGCLAGICGRCKVRLLSGNVTMAEQEGLSSAERDSGIILACQAKPVGNIAVEA
jgi:glycine betaine catabolism B